MKQPKDDTDKSIKAYQQAKASGLLGPEVSYEQFIKLKTPSTNINNAPSPAAGYRNIYDEQGRVVRQEPVPGGPVDIKQKQDAEQAEADLLKSSQQQQQTKVKNTEFLSQVDAAIDNNTFWTTGMLGKVLSVFPGSDARFQEKLLERIQGEVALNRLAEAQAASKTGGVFGSLQKAELDLLKNSLEALEVGMSADQMERGLLGIKEHRLKWDGYNELWNDPAAIKRGFKGFGRYVPEEGGVEILNAENYEKYTTEVRTGIKQDYTRMGVYQ